MINERNVFYDELKGFAMTLVVLGHAIQNTYANNFDEHELFRLIYSFHMPLFMFLSGAVSFFRCENSIEGYNINWLKRRAFSLCLPFASWIILPFVFTNKWNQLPQKVLDVIKSPDNANWFLWILFLNCLILFIVYKITMIPLGVSAFGICIVLFFVAKRFLYLGIGMLAWYCVFFMGGHFVQKYKYRIIKYRWYIGLGGTILWIILVPYWRRGQIPTFLEYVTIIPRWIVGFVEIMFKYSVGFTGIIMSMFFIWLLRKKISLRVFRNIGNRTIEIYILQWFFFDIIKVKNGFFQVILSFALGLIIPFLIAEIFENKLERKLLFGKS